jgi:hypothetical protein
MHGQIPGATQTYDASFSGLVGLLLAEGWLSKKQASFVDKVDEKLVRRAVIPGPIH